MATAQPFPFWHRVLILLFAGGIVAIGSQELLGRSGGLRELAGSLVPSLSLNSLRDEIHEHERELHDAGHAVVPWEETGGEQVRAQYSSRRMEPRSTAAVDKQGGEVSRQEGAERPIRKVDQSTDALERADRRELDSLLETVTK